MQFVKSSLKSNTSTVKIVEESDLQHIFCDSTLIATSFVQRFRSMIFNPRYSQTYIIVGENAAM